MSASIIVADPPWKFASNSDAKPGRNARRHYACMTDAEIAALPVRDWAAPDAILFLWTTSPLLERAFPIIRAWGFKYSTNIVWNKLRVGTGFVVRGKHEHVLIARRGKFKWPRPAPFPSSIIESGRREHSRKPDELYAEICRIWPDMPKLELFARTRRPGWSAWGDQVDRFQVAAE